VDPRGQREGLATFPLWAMVRAEVPSVTQHKKSFSKFPLKKLTADQRDRLDQIEREAIRGFRGQFDDLERALGALRLAPHLGWKPLVVIHSKSTIAKYEEILGIKFSDVSDPEGPSAPRSVGYGLVRSASNFWKAVTGEEPVEKLDRKSRKEAI
jgi:hypothetical protein